MNICRPFLQFIAIALTIGGVSAVCYEDNVYRGILHRGDVPFCSTYLAASYSMAISIEPVYLATEGPSRVSSACSCVLARTTSSTSASTTSLIISSTTAPTTSPTVSTSHTSAEWYPKPSSSSLTASACLPNSASPTFTGVHPKLQQNLASCYALPTPIINLQQLPVPTSNESSIIQYFYYSLSDRTSKYLGVRTPSNDSYIIDASNSSALGIVGSQGSWLFIDADGIRFGTQNCSLVFEIRIDNFAEQINNQISNGTDLQTRTLFPRGEIPCENAIISFIDGIPGGFPRVGFGTIPPLVSWSNVFKSVAPYVGGLLRQGAIAEAFVAVGLLAGPEIIAVGFIIQDIMAIMSLLRRIFGDNIAYQICCKFHGGC